LDELNTKTQRLEGHEEEENTKKQSNKDHKGKLYFSLGALCVLGGSIFFSAEVLYKILCPFAS
jgi:hypothetical protein